MRIDGTMHSGQFYSLKKYGEAEQETSTEQTAGRAELSEEGRAALAKAKETPDAVGVIQMEDGSWHTLRWNLKPMGDKLLENMMKADPYYAVDPDRTIRNEPKAQTEQYVKDGYQKLVDYYADDLVEARESGDPKQWVMEHYHDRYKDAGTFRSKLSKDQQEMAIRQLTSFLDFDRPATWADKYALGGKLINADEFLSKAKSEAQAKLDALLGEWKSRYGDDVEAWVGAFKELHPEEAAKWRTPDMDMWG